MKFVPFTVSVNAGPSAVVEFGESVAMIGTGFGAGFTVTGPEPDLLVSCTLVAVTVTVAGLGTFAGAV